MKKCEADVVGIYHDENLSETRLTKTWCHSGDINACELLRQFMKTQDDVNKKKLGESLTLKFMQFRTETNKKIDMNMYAESQIFWGCYHWPYKQVQTVICLVDINNL